MEREREKKGVVCSAAVPLTEARRRRRHRPPEVLPCVWLGPSGEGYVMDRVRCRKGLDTFTRSTHVGNSVSADEEQRAMERLDDVFFFFFLFFFFFFFLFL